ncbi:MAG TPA: LysM domain-containing protein [Chloroflexi bacterium]|nr:LysM domain-containing protein [Chloroflexota bacterium]
MDKKHLSLPLYVMILAVVLSLLTGCYREAAPDVEPTVAGDVQADQPTDEATPVADAQMATAIANATLAAQPPDESAEETPVPPTPPPPPTATPQPEPTTPSTTAVPTFTPQPESAEPTALPAVTGQTTHTVQRGENLFRIALRYGTTVQEVAAANGIANPALIYVGQVLTIPAAGVTPPPAGGTTYVVQPGDNLFRIALRYNMSYLYLAQYNNIANPSSIYVGQVIRIP